MNCKLNQLIKNIQFVWLRINILGDSKSVDKEYPLLTCYYRNNYKVKYQSLKVSYGIIKILNQVMECILLLFIWNFNIEKDSVAVFYQHRNCLQFYYRTGIFRSFHVAHDSFAVQESNMIHLQFQFAMVSSAFLVLHRIDFRFQYRTGFITGLGCPLAQKAYRWRKHYITPNGRILVQIISSIHPLTDP